MRLFLFLTFICQSSFGLAKVDTSTSFLSLISLNIVLTVVFSIGAGLSVLALLLFSIQKALEMFGLKYVRGHGLWKKDTYNLAMRQLDNHRRRGGILDRDSRSELARWQLDRNWRGDF